MFGIQRSILMITAIGLLLIIIITLGPAACNKIRSLTAQNRMNEAQHGALKNSAHDAVETVGKAAERERAGEAEVRRENEEIRNAEGADKPVDAGVGAAGVRALCAKPGFDRDPKCRLLQPRP